MGLDERKRKNVYNFAVYRDLKTQLLIHFFKDNSKDIVYVELNYLEVFQTRLRFPLRETAICGRKKKGLTKTDSQSISDPMAYQWKKGCL